jgi:hypothetical protein
VGNRREGGDEPQKKRNDSDNLRLLKHHLANPNPVWVAIAAPGQIAAMAREPSKKAAWQPSYSGFEKQWVKVSGKG